MLYNIYVYVLNNGKFLLCPRLATDLISNNSFNNESFKNESSFLYQEILRNNPISHLSHIEENVKSWEIDSWVHMYMQNYGIENVRGGRYNMLEIENKEEISNAIKYFANSLNEQEGRIQTYKIISSERETLDETALRDSLVQYKKLEKEREKYKIDRNIIYDLNWLIQCIKDGNAKICDEYYKLMSQLSLVYKKYLNVVEDASDKVGQIHGNHRGCALCNIYYEKPYVFFDCRFIKRERELNNYDYESDNQIKCVVQIFELAIFSLINREEEILFEMEQINVREIEDKLFIIANSSRNADCNVPM
jgi:hypothetical protein